MTTVEDVLVKLQKLKELATVAPDISSLEKVSEKVSKIRLKLDSSKGNKELSAIIDKIHMLITEKNKYYRQIIIKNSSKHIIQHKEDTKIDQANQTLKHSKSANNLQLPGRKNMEKPNDKLFGISKSVINDEKPQKSQVNDEQMTFKSSRSKLTQPGQNIYIKNRKSQQSIKFPHGSRNNILKNQDEDRTQIIMRKQQMNQDEKNELVGEINTLEQKLGISFKKIDNLQKRLESIQTVKQPQRPPHISPMTKNYLSKQQEIIEEYTKKLREKSYIIQDLKGKVQYLKTTNDDLKGKLINQQRRHDDYVEQIKQQSKGLKKTIQKLKRENEEMRQQIDELDDKNSELMNEIKKVVSKLQEEQKSKEQEIKNLQNRSNNKIRELQCDIGQLTAQLNTSSKLQVKVEQQIQERKNIMKLKTKLDDRISELEQQSKKYQQERDSIELQMFKIREQNQIIRTQLKIQSQAKDMLADELLQIQSKLQKQHKLTQMVQYEGQMMTKNKLSKLKEIRELITELR